MKTLCVILGAGASRDLIPKENGNFNFTYLPPLAANLFTSPAIVPDILSRYPKAQSLASLIKTEILKRGKSLEGVLKELQNSEKQTIQNQLIQIPLYIQELIGEVSTHFTNEPYNYTYLYNRCKLMGIEKIYFLTLNYDTFLELAIGNILDYSFKDLLSYTLPNNDFMILKLHGSVNWGRNLNKYHLENEWSHSSYMKIINDITLKDIGDSFVLLGSYQNRFKDNIPYYPALALPVEGKYEYICPDYQLNTFKEALKSTTNYLVIGTRGIDNDLTDLLKENIRSADSLSVIGMKSAENVLYTFKEKVPQFEQCRVSEFFDDGFSQSIMGSYLDTFLAKLR